MLAITVNTRNNQKTDRSACLCPMANVRLNARKRWFNVKCPSDDDRVACSARERKCHTH